MDCSIIYIPTIIYKYHIQIVYKNYKTIPRESEKNIIYIPYTSHLSDVPVGRDGLRVLSVLCRGRRAARRWRRRPRACMRTWPMLDVIGAVPRTAADSLNTEIN